MALGDLTKQIAQQAILSATTKESAPQTEKHQPENLGSILLAQISAMQKALKEDEELLVLYQNGPERIRVMEIFLPSWRLAVLTGMDAERARARVISPVESLQLVVKIIKAPPGSKPARIPLVAPKS